MNIKNPLPTGTILKGKSYNYCIEKALGQGSFGITYLASVKMQGALGEIDSNIQLAVKEFFMKETNGRDGNTVTTGSKGGVFDKYRTKFAREAENLSRLHHPNIVKVLESFEANNTVYYAMEYIDGGSLNNHISQNKGLSEKESIRYLKQIGEALSYMHHNKMLHLDLKPDNIVLRKNGEAVLIDFGLAKQYDNNGKPETSTSVGLGTPGYAPIEQSDYRDGKGFPMEMDVYALGATFFKMLLGVRPPDASSILNDGFPIYELQEHHVSDSLISVVAKAMAPLKKDRYQNVEQFMDALKSERKEEEYILWEEEKAQYENALPIGCQLYSESSVYKIIACVGKDSCSFVYKAIKKGQISEEVILLENMPNEFLGGRVGDISTGKYEMDFSISDLHEWTELFDEKIKILSRNYKVIERFSVGYFTDFVSFKAPIKKELLDACCMTKHFTKKQYNETEEKNSVKTQLFTVPQNTQRIIISYREYGVPCPSNFNVQITRKDIRIEHFYLNEETLSTQLFTKRRFQNLKNEISAFQMKCTSEKRRDFGEGGTEIILTFIDEKYYTLNTISTRVRDDNSLYILESNKNIAYEIERLLPEVVEFISENKQKLELKHAQNNNNQPLKGNTSEKEKSWLGILGELVGLILTTYLPLIGIILIFIVILNVNGLGQLIATGVISTCSLYYTIKAEYFDNKFMKFFFILLYTFFIFYVIVGICNGRY